MTTIRDIAHIADEKEKERIDELITLFNHEKPFSSTDVFGGKEIPRLLGESPLSFSSSLMGAWSSLPLNSLLYSRIVVKMCPKCLNGDPSLLKPYLERNLILPILIAPLANYRTSMIQELIKHPFIGWLTASFHKRIQACLECPGERGIFYPYCPNEQKNIDKYEKPQKRII